MSCTIISDCAACTREYHHTSKALSQGPAVRRQFLRDARASAGTPREKDARGVPPGQVRTAARAAKPQPLRRVARARRSPTNLGSWRPRSRPLVLPDRPASARSGPTRLHLHMLRRRPRALLGVGARCGSDERVAARFRRRNSTGRGRWRVLWPSPPAGALLREHWQYQRRGRRRAFWLVQAAAAARGDGERRVIGRAVLGAGSRRWPLVPD